MEIDYTKIIRNCVEPKLAYHGFKYNEEKSHEPTGHYEFTREYFGKRQRVSISRVQYDLRDVSRLTADSDDIPIELSQDLMLIQEPGYRLWLSNRFISAVVGHEYVRLEVTRTGLADYTPFKQLADLPSDEADHVLRQLRKNHLWCEFHNEKELRQVLADIVDVVLTEGLNWFDEQVNEIRRHHNKLNARQKAEKLRRKTKPA